MNTTFPKLSNKSASSPDLSLSRFAGFTQSQTSSAWCEANVLTVFNDTGSEIKTLESGGAISGVGFSTSSNYGGQFTYMGSPPISGNFDQMLLGSPVAACADETNFYYAALWLDLLNNVTGVAFAHSADGAQSFGALSLAVSKSALTDFPDHDWLAIDPNNRLLMYLVYADVDFSGNTCGTDPSSGSAIPRYAIEMVSSGNGGNSWSSPPTVIEQVCADNSNEWAAVMGPQVAIGPAGEVYVAFEAQGENGAPATSRQIKIAKSFDNGSTFAPAVIVSGLTPVGDGADLQGFLRANEFPSIAIGKGAKDTGYIYLAWNNGGVLVPDLLTTTGSYAFADIEFAVSTDGGATFSQPLKANNNAKGGTAPLTDQFEPAIGADKKGNLAICFYDRRHDANNFRIDRECAKSSNAGASWSNKKITSSNFAVTVGQDLFVAPDYMGDFDTVVSDSTGAKSGLIDSYASNYAGNPNIMSDKE